MYRTGTLFAAILVSGAAAAYNPAHTYNEIRVVNNSDAPVSDVTVLHKPSGRSYSCETVKPLQVCTHYHGKRRFDPGPFEVSWRFDGGAAQTETIEVRVPSFFPTGLALQGIFEIDAAGNMSLRHEQYSPL